MPGDPSLISAIIFSPVVGVRRGFALASSLLLLLCGGCTSSPDLDPPACAEQFVAGRFSPQGLTTGEFCSLLPAGVSLNRSGCEPLDLNVGTVSSPGINVGGPIGMFSSPGPSLLGVAMVGRGLPCAGKAEACGFRTRGYTCSATIVRSGRVGQMVEVVLNGPCVLHEYDFSGNRVAELRLSVLRLRGTLRLGTDVTDSSDGGLGSDCGVN